MVSEETTKILCLNFKGGGSFVSQKPQFSYDGETVYVAWKKSILAYNTRTGKLVNEYKGLDKNIVGFSIHNYDGYECLIGCSENCEVVVWKTVTHFKIFERHIPKKSLKSFYMLPSQDETKIDALISYVQFKKNVIQFAVVDIMKKTVTDLKLKIKKDEPFAFDFSKAGYLAVIQKNAVYFESFNKSEAQSRQYIQKSRNFTCIACHPSEEIVLTGDSTGRVLVWQKIFQKDKAQSVFHWHTLPVNCVGFSTVGSYFYSGGDECVLVKWQLDNSNHKLFVPRLPDAIEHVTVSSDNVFVAVSTADNAVRILDSKLNLVTLIQNLVLGKQCESGMIYDTKTDSLIMNGNTGSVQFYSPRDMSLLYNIEIVGQNKITNERDCTMANTEVKKVALSIHSSWLATIEEREDEIYSIELRLKFWQFNTEKQKFQLNTSIEYPHETSVNSIMFQPADKDENLRCCTVGDDRLFKMWQLINADTVYKKGEAWKCVASCFYNDLMCKSLSFCADGSLMAVGFDNLLTVWAPDSCEIKTVLSHCYHREKLTHVQFGNGDENYFVVTASRNQLSVWNLMTLRLAWTVRVKDISLLVADPSTNHMAVFTGHKKLFVFTPGCKDAVFSSNTLLKDQKVVAATFIPNREVSHVSLPWHERSHLYFITKQNELCCVSKDEEGPEYKGEFDSFEKSLFSAMIPHSKVDIINKAIAKRHLYEEDIRRKTINEYLEAPLQTLAPIRLTCFSLLKSMILEQDKVKD